MKPICWGDFAFHALGGAVVSGVLGVVFDLRGPFDVSGETVCA